MPILRLLLLSLTLGLFLGSEASAQPMVVVYSDDSVAIGTTRQFTAYVTVTPSTVVWSVNDIPGGNATLGTITASGLYTAPPVAPSPNNVVIVKATSTAQPSIFGSARVSVQQPTPNIWSLRPSTINKGAYQITLNGSNFVPGAVVNFGGQPVTTQYVNSTTLVATGTANTAGTIKVTATNPAPGTVTSASINLTVRDVTSTPTVSVSPTSATLNTAATRQFTATVANTTNTGVTWSVNGVNGGNATVGTISTSGLYTAPSAVPSPATVTVRATSVANTSVSATASVTVQAVVQTPPPVLSNVNPSSIPAGAFTLTLTGTGFVSGSVVQFGGTDLSTTFVSSTQLVAAGSTQAAGTNVSVSVRNPGGVQSASLSVAVQTATPTVVSRLGAARFLEQATFGPSPALIQKVQQSGYDAFLQEQFALPETTVPLTTGMSFSTVRANWLYMNAHAPDQLRQKTAYALGQILVISANKVIYPDEYVPWLRLLSRNAFGNYRTLLREATISPSMGKYLDLANSTKPNANENYPREVMQLFSIGLWELNKDGSQKLDANGKPIPTYNQATVRQFALALSGWTYPTAPGATPAANNWEYFVGDMEPRPNNHDTSPKTLLNGVVLPAGQSVVQDLDGVVDCLFNHPNLPPFVAIRLIRSMVKSNPSPAYISRVADAFINNGAGIRGDMKAVVKAVLLDPEARQDTADATSGKLRDPITHVTALVRALNGTIAQNNQFAYIYGNMGQDVLAPNSVFSFYSPNFRIPGSTLYGPEFQIYTPTESVLRSNFIYSIMTNNSGSDIKFDLTPFTAVAGNTTALLDAVDNALLYGRMSAQMRASLAKAIDAQYDNQNRMLTAVYLTAASAQYAVQY